jgi:hypothetical protein
MKKALLTIALLATGLFSCSKSDDGKLPAVALTLSGSIYYDSGSAYNGITHYKHLSFTSATDIDMYTSYLIGESTNIYTGHLNYTITSQAGGSASDVTVTGKDGFGDPVNDTYTYHPGNRTLTLGTATYTKFK